MKYLTKVDGKVSWTNVLALVVVLASGLYPIWQPFIPESAYPYIGAAIGSLVFILRTFQSDGTPIQK